MKMDVLRCHTADGVLDDTIPALARGLTGVRDRPGLKKAAIKNKTAITPAAQRPAVTSAGIGAAGVSRKYAAKGFPAPADEGAASSSNNCCFRALIDCSCSGAGFMMPSS
jgi:hypothetical protein